ncbi:hypothetical protein [Mycolicibacterium fortuitum]|uniref:Uncharacterized protein n=2 Tax=Mycolicibacterium fortuitum TaxID=1766 RepID=A0AAE4V9E0_MYCFO|nr:hypothetical protein [Mycolicibacterium fortuitum]MCV7141403.1 hypothetical protein [Mycolicibacterium fortuitum]MDV7189599.1 hypothetical protein [Mycolicibacterium fortuitum]MDV7203104.1 hypothetical protein [Mycolicibacterium fortuitum]MDV7224680.1 hypothetical protein [Mycolicibacterium fortuitum]MDV7256802.1 hypothetical protein [Mycolicibacterium fortuitum]
MPAPIAEAYRQSGALEVECSHCGAEVGNYCTRDDGRVRRTPCVARCRISSPAPGWLDPDGGPDAAAGRTGPVQVLDLDYPDPSEPRHPRGDE